MCLFEGTNISEGRGATRPFEIFGAPFIDAEKLCTELSALKLPGVFFRENYFQPTFQKFAGQLCAGAQIHVIDRERFQPFRTGVEIIKHIPQNTYPEHFQWKQPPYEYDGSDSPSKFLIGGPIESFLATDPHVVGFIVAAALNSQLHADIPWPEVVQRLAYENDKLARRPQGHNGEYFVVCTLYYTPKESGFTFERGFDATAVRNPGLHGRKYPRDFCAP